jgi:hypothetical protein
MQFGPSYIDTVPMRTYPVWQLVQRSMPLISQYSGKSQIPSRPCRLPAYSCPVVRCRPGVPVQMRGCVKVDWQLQIAVSTPEIIRAQNIDIDDGAGVLWSSDPGDTLELSALGVLAWEGREDKPSGDRYEWTGFNLLCNAAPTPFSLGGERFYSIDSFYEALKLPEGTPERAACATAPMIEAKRLARRNVGGEFTYRGTIVSVGSADHAGLLAAAICAKLEQNRAVQSALLETGTARLTFPLTFNSQPGPLARVTPLTLMIERWKQRRRPR